MSEDLADIVIESCTALVHDTEGAIGFFENATIVIRDGRIETITTGDLSPVASTERIDGRGMVAMPGLINCHTHASMVMFRGAAEDVPIDRWFNDFIWPMEVNLTDTDVRLGAQLAAAEMIRSGITTFADHYFSMDRVAEVVVETGLRANLGAAFFSSQGQSGREDSLAFALRWRDAAGGRITTSLAPHATYTVDEADLRATAALASEHRLPIHIHASESREQTRSSRASLGVTPIEVLRRTGVLDSHTIIAHGRGIVEEDLPTLAAVAGRVGVATSPKGYLKFGFETTPIRALRSVGVPVGLATDGAASNSTLDVWESMEFTALVQKSREDPRDERGHRIARCRSPRRRDPRGHHRAANAADPRSRRNARLQRAFIRCGHDHRRRTGVDA
jgi:5-methylthioadenosine/S-adenosylhomocysteine deaminase